MEEAKGRKRKEHESEGREAAKAARIVPAMIESEGEMEMEEEAVAEVMKWLGEETGAAALPDFGSSPFYHQETSFITINGNEESCGSSFSCSASTVMASVDTAGGAGGVPYFAGCPSEWPSATPLVHALAYMSAAPIVAMTADGCDNAAGEEEEEGEVEWVAQARGCGGAAIDVEESSVQRESNIRVKD